MWATVECMVESMLNNYCKTIDENQHLSEELHTCSEIVRSHFDTIETLENENQKLKDENEKLHSGSSQELPDGTDNASDNDNTSTETTNDLKDCMSELKQLHQQLAEKDKMIEEIINEFEHLKISNEPDNLSISSAAAPSSPSEKTNETEQVNESNESEKISTTSNQSYETDLLGESAKLKIHELGELTAELANIFEAMQDKLLEQQMEIDDLSKRSDMKMYYDEIVNAEKECQAKLKEMEQRELILAHQSKVLEEEIAVLMDERHKLMTINNGLIRSISICKAELCSYNFE